MSRESVIVLGLLAVVLLGAVLVRLLRPRGRRPRPADLPAILVDGSNVMHWRDNAPDLATLRAVIARVREAGWEPAVVFDANAGYRLTGRYMGDAALARALGLNPDQVLVAPRGTPADPLLLAAARDTGAPVVSNDRYRDWAEQFPEVMAPGRLVRGGWGQGGLTLPIAAPGAPDKAAGSQAGRA